jgi:hypothetical protein
MRHRDDLHSVAGNSIHEKKWKSAKQVPASSFEKQRPALRQLGHLGNCSVKFREKGLCG